MRLLLVEDVPALASLTAKVLQASGFAVDVASSAADARSHLIAAPPDVVVLDLGLPDANGLDVLAAWRAAGVQTPVLVVTARAGLNDRIDGLDGGADDWLVKPAAPAEIAARCRALLRRPGRLLGARLTAGDLVFDTASRTAEAGGRRVALQRRDGDVLEVLMRRIGSVVNRRVIEDAVYALLEAPGPNALEAAVSRLRRALRDAGAAVEIHTIRGVGYMLSEPLP